MFDDILKQDEEEKGKTCYTCKYGKLVFMCLYCSLNKTYKGFNGQVCEHYEPIMADEPKW